MQPFNLTERIEFYKKSLIIDESILIIGDIHLGYEDALNKQGVMIPRIQYDIIKKDLDKLLKKYKKVSKIIINGDLKHEFGKISRQEYKDVKDFISLIKKEVKDIVIIKGNHDKVIMPLVKDETVTIKEYDTVNDIYITHGDRIDNNQDFSKAKIVIIGHEHPCIALRDVHKSEKFKAFLVGKYDNKNLIVIPSFNPIEGTDIAQENLISPFLKDNPHLKNFEVFITADRIYEFGELKDLIKR